MENDRRNILRLVAMGRITPAEAERLLMAWNEGCESTWVIVCCLIGAVLTQLPSIHMTGGIVLLAHGIKLFTHVLGGIV